MSRHLAPIKYLVWFQFQLSQQRSFGLLRFGCGRHRRVGNFEAEFRRSPGLLLGFRCGCLSLSFGSRSGGLGVYRSGVSETSAALQKQPRRN